MVSVTSLNVPDSSCYQARRGRPAALLLPGPPPLALDSTQAANSNFPTHFLKYQEVHLKFPLQSFVGFFPEN